MNAGSCQFTHRMDAMLFQSADGAGPSLPEIGGRLVIPEQIPEGFFIELCDTDTVLVRGSMLGGDAGGVQYLPNHCHGEVVCIHFIMSRRNKYAHFNAWKQLYFYK